MKKTTYKLEDGDVIIATSAQDFVTKLRDGSKFDNQCTTFEYMQNFAKRLKEYNGCVIRADTHENFLFDLIDTECVFVLV